MKEDEKLYGEKEAYEELSNAIVIQAVKDYKRALATLKRNPYNVEARGEKQALKQFFASDYFALLTAVNPFMIIKKIEEEML